MNKKKAEVKKNEEPSNMFDREESRYLWRDISGIIKKKNRRTRKKLAFAIWDAVYSLASRCEELECHLKFLIENNK